MLYAKIVKLFLRLALAAGFLSASADRLGWWNAKNSAWGDWQNFLKYTQLINPWFPKGMIPAIGFIATSAEIILGICLFLGVKTRIVGMLSGILLLIFALSMAFSTGIKTAFDASVFAASAGAFALSTIQMKFLELV